MILSRPSISQFRQLLRTFKLASMKHPENTDNQYEWSEESLQTSLKLRQIWKDSLIHENDKIRAMLQNAWFPYLEIIKNYLKIIKDGYELESTVFVVDRPILTLPVDKIIEVYAEVTFYLLPELTDDDIDEDKDFEIIPLKFNKKQETYIKKLLKKFSDEIKLPAVLIYE